MSDCPRPTRLFAACNSKEILLNDKSDKKILLNDKKRQNCSRLKKKVNHRGSNRVNRGGSWNNNPQNCRATNRNNNTPTNRNNNLGFRVVRSPQLKVKSDDCR